MWVEIPKRVILCILMFCGLITNYMLRVNINISILEMTKNTTELIRNNTEMTNNTTEIHTNTSVTVTPGFAWTHIEKGWILSSFYYGYFAMQLPGGRLAEMFGCKSVFGFSMAGTAALAALTPLLAPLGVWVVILVRVLQGFLEAASYPALTQMISKWAPESEKSFYTACALIGGTSGTIITFPLCGLILFYYSWQAVFYITSAITFLWFFIWMFLVYENPEDHPGISDAELYLITSTRTYNQGRQASERSVPILPLLYDAVTCPAMLAVMLCEFANNWGLNAILVYGPTFMYQVLGFDIKANGFFNALPFLMRLISSVTFGFISGRLISNNLVSKIRMQKINQVFATLLPGAGMIWLSYEVNHKLLCIAIMSISFGFTGAIFAGHTLNNITIAPNRAGTAMGLSNGFGNIAGFLAPMVTSILLEGTTTVEEELSRWKIVFGIPSIMYTLALASFLIWGSGDVQNFNWRMYSRQDDTGNVVYSKITMKTGKMESDNLLIQKQSHAEENSVE